MKFNLHHGDCIEVMRSMADASVDSIVCDPPYLLGFMGKAWDAADGIAGKPEVWREALRVLKPGGHLLAFGAPRTNHRMVTAIEDAGFEIRDSVQWIFGCLDAATQFAAPDGVMPYHKAKVGSLALCYDADHETYSYQPILEVVEYDYSDTAYRLIGPFGEQVVSKNHRCIVELGGREIFQFAETLECEAYVPFLENLPALQQALHDAHEGAGETQYHLHEGVRVGNIGREKQRAEVDARGAQGSSNLVRSVSKTGLESRVMDTQGENISMQLPMQRCTARRGVETSCSQRSGKLEGGIRGRACGTYDGGDQSSMEGGAYLPKSQGGVCESINQICAMPTGVSSNGAQGWVCDGAQAVDCAGGESPATQSGGGTPHKPRCNRQHSNKLDAFCNERTAQGVRAWGGHHSTLVRVVPFHYTGKVWCLRVPTGAFVAVRNGVAFPTGNSGFPKSLNIGKAIDKAAGAVREVIGLQKYGDGQTYGERAAAGRSGGGIMGEAVARGASVLTAPATPAAQQWQGFGTALKPAYEPVCVARKPLDKSTVAANVLAHGCGGINIDGCRVEGETWKAHRATGFGSVKFFAGDAAVIEKEPHEKGRWPANIILDGSAEVEAIFPETGTSTGGKHSGRKGTREQVGDFGFERTEISRPLDNGGSAARFFYCAKTSNIDRHEGQPNPGTQFAHGTTLRKVENTITKGNHHPTVKPTSLMAYLCRLVTPPGGTVLDCFMGSGSTGKAAVMEGFNFIGIEQNAEYVEIARARIEFALRQHKQSQIDFDSETTPQPNKHLHGQLSIYE